MKVFKFGGASVKSVEAVKNIASIIKPHLNEKLVVVVSAMGKSTNALERIIHLCEEGVDYDKALEEFQAYHNDIAIGLLGKGSQKTLDKISAILDDTRTSLKNEVLLKNQDMLYSEVVSKGELISTLIVSDYLNAVGIINEWVDARKYIKTDKNFIDGRVNWQSTEELVEKGIKRKLDDSIVITQGFIASDHENNTTTLGREGSDFTAGILAWCLEASSATIWKDVPGILNADPKLIPEATKFGELPYKEASEMTYYGAKVIHPKTIRPLATKGIPLFVKGFNSPNEPGTKIYDCQAGELAPSVIFMPNQCLISFKVVDYNFVNEKNLSVIFHSLAELDMKINIMQNSAISFSICVDYDKNKIAALFNMIKESFDMYYNTGLELVTIKNYTAQSLVEYRPKGHILLEQKTRNNYRFLVSTNGHMDI